MVNAPTKLRIIGKTFQIKTFEPNPLANGLQGFHDSNLQVITLQTGNGFDDARDTLLHEVIHAIDYGIQVNLEERQVHALASGLYAVMRDNPDFVAWLMENAND